MNLEIQTNRNARKYPYHELILRVLWAALWPVFRFSPRLCWGWRRSLLRLFGANIGKRVNIFPSARIFAPWHFSIGDDSSIGFDALIYNLGTITIGNRVTLSQRAHLCAGSHDYRDPTMPLQKPPIHIADEVWICADAFVGPGVTLGEGSVIAARSVVVKNVTPWMVMAGNPAKSICKREFSV